MTYVGEAASLLAAVCWAVGICLFTKFGRGYSAQLLNVLKGLVASLFVLACIVVIQSPMPTDPILIAELALSGIIGIAIGDTALIASLPRVGAQVASAGFCLSSPITAVIAWITLGETLNSTEWLGLVITLLAILGVFYSQHRLSRKFQSLSQGKDLWIGLGLALIAPVGHGVGIVLGRHAISQTDVLPATFLRVFSSLVFLSAMVWWRTGKVSFTEIRKNKGHFPSLIIASLIGSGLGILLLSIAMKHSRAGMTVALSNIFPIFVIPIAVLFLKERTNWFQGLCTCLAVLGVALLLNLF